MATRTTVNRCRMNFVYNRKTTLGTKCIQRWEQDLYNLYTRFIQLVSKNNIAILSWFSAISVVLSLCIQLVYNFYTTCIQNLYSHKTVTVVQPQNNVGNKIYTTCRQLLYNSSPNLKCTKFTDDMSDLQTCYNAPGRRVKKKALIMHIITEGRP